MGKLYTGYIQYDDGGILYIRAEISNKTRYYLTEDRSQAAKLNDEEVVKLSKYPNVKFKEVTIDGKQET